jgi:hypothetical protein
MAFLLYILNEDKVLPKEKAGINPLHFAPMDSPITNIENTRFS